MYTITVKIHSYSIKYTDINLFWVRSIQTGKLYKKYIFIQCHMLYTKKLLSCIKNLTKTFLIFLFVLIFPSGNMYLFVQTHIVLYI